MVLCIKSISATLLAAGLCASTAIPSWSQESLSVVASIKPIQSLVAQVMGDLGTPDVIVEGASSPHNYTMRPSHARMLQQADIVFWVGEDLETFLEGPIENLSGDAKAIELMETDGVQLLAFREAGEEDHDEHDHDKHGHDDHSDHEEHADHDEHDHDDHSDHDEHKHEHADHDDHDHDHDKHDHDKEKASAEGHDEHDHDDHGHAHGENDVHIWLDPQNAVAMLSAIADTLAEADSANAETYKANAEKAAASLNALSEELAEKTKPIADKDFIVFHDAYQYFEARYGMERPKPIAINPTMQPGAARMKQLRELVKDSGVSCIFSEPQFPSALTDTLVEGTNVKVAVLDPLGSTIDSGQNHYANTLTTLADSFIGCLGNSN